MKLLLAEDSKDIQPEFSTTLAMLFDRYGMEYAINIVFTKLATLSPLKRMSIILLHMNSNTRLVLADIQKTDAEYNKEVETAWLHPLSYRKYLFTRDTEQGFNYPDITLETSHEAGKMLELFPGVRSVFSMTLMRMDYLAVSMIFSSDTPNAFSERHLDMFRKASRIFGDEFCRRYFPEVAQTPAGKDRVRTKSPIELLRMCDGMKQVVRRIEMVAPTTSTVLIQGESGTGKELAAKSVHELSQRQGKPFIKVNCGAITESLLLSELFGHERGAFTGATAAHAGFFEQADGGTIFLDEISELSAASQAALLHTLGNKEIQRVGSGRLTKVDVRVIAASNVDLAQLCRQGRFRQDLLYRLSVFPLNLPPLRARRLDIPVLAQYFLDKKSAEMGLPAPAMSKSELHKLCCAKWPGNVRQLEHVLEQAIIMSRENPDAPVLRTHIDGEDPGEAQAETPRTPRAVWPDFDEHVRGYLEQVLEHVGGKINGPGGACELLGLSPGTLRGKMRKYNVAVPQNKKIPRVRRKKAG